MTALEANELKTQAGATDFARLIAACKTFGPYCLIGGLAVNCFVEPVHTQDADLVATASNLTKLAAHLREQGFRAEVCAHLLFAMAPVNQFPIHVRTDERYQPFLSRAIDAEVLGIDVKIACLEDVTQGKLWALSDPRRSPHKRKKDELALIRLAQAHPRLTSLYPPELRRQIGRA